MASLSMHMLGSALALAGWMGSILSCILPMWRVTAFVGTTIVTAQIMWEGIWMSCVSQSTGHIQCKPYESTLALGSDLIAAQILTALSILTGALGLVSAFVGGKCTRFLDNESETTKSRVATAAGVELMLAGMLCLIPVSWSAGVVVQMFYSQQVTDTQRREIGAAIYIGWGASILLLLGGGMLCSTSCHRKAEDIDGHSVKYALVRSSRAASSMGSQRVWVVKPTQRGAPSMTSQGSDKKTTASLHLERPSSTGSSYSKASRKSQLTVTTSEKSEGPSTKSQLMQADSDHSLSASQISEKASAKPEKTYI